MMCCEALVGNAGRAALARVKLVRLVRRHLSFFLDTAWTRATCSSSACRELGLVPRALVANEPRLGPRVMSSMVDSQWAVRRRALRRRRAAPPSPLRALGKPALVIGGQTKRARPRPGRAAANDTTGFVEDPSSSPRAARALGSAPSTTHSLRLYTTQQTRDSSPPRDPRAPSTLADTASPHSAWPRPEPP